MRYTLIPIVLFGFRDVNMRSSIEGTLCLKQGCPVGKLRKTAFAKTAPEKCNEM